MKNQTITLKGMAFLTIASSILLCSQASAHGVDAYQATHCRFHGYKT
jgi:hypothetical protein